MSKKYFKMSLEHFFQLKNNKAYKNFGSHGVSNVYNTLLYNSYMYNSLDNT